MRRSKSQKPPLGGLWLDIYLESAPVTRIRDICPKLPLYLRFIEEKIHNRGEEDEDDEDRDPTPRDVAKREYG